MKLLNSKIGLMNYIVDIWRAMRKEQSLEVFAATVLNKLSKIKNQQLSSSVKLVQDAVNSIQQIALKFSGLLDKDLIEATARQFAFRFDTHL
jgi:hypothetical protein